MSENITKAMASGEAFGAQLLEVVKWHESQFSDDKEKLLWWAAFMGYLGGMCAASIGTEATKAIETMTLKTTGMVLAQKMN